MDLYRAEGEDLPPRKTYYQRKCLMCTRVFQSRHRFNRLCRKCKEKIESKGFNGNAYFDEHSPSDSLPG